MDSDTTPSFDIYQSQYDNAEDAVKQAFQLFKENSIYWDDVLSIISRCWRNLSTVERENIKVKLIDRMSDKESFTLFMSFFNSNFKMDSYSSLLYDVLIESVSDSTCKAPQLPTIQGGICLPSSSSLNLSSTLQMQLPQICRWASDTMNILVWLCIGSSSSRKSQTRMVTQILSFQNHHYQVKLYLLSPSRFISTYSFELHVITYSTTESTEEKFTLSFRFPYSSHLFAFPAAFTSLCTFSFDASQLTFYVDSTKMNTIPIPNLFSEGIDDAFVGDIPDSKAYRTREASDSDDVSEPDNNETPCEENQVVYDVKENMIILTGLCLVEGKLDESVLSAFSSYGCPYGLSSSLPPAISYYRSIFHTPTDLQGGSLYYVLMCDFSSASMGDDIYCYVGKRKVFATKDGMLLEDSMQSMSCSLIHKCACTVFQNRNPIQNFYVFDIRNKLHNHLYGCIYNLEHDIEEEITIHHVISILYVISYLVLYDCSSSMLVFNTPFFSMINQVFTLLPYKGYSPKLADAIVFLMKSLLINDKSKDKGTFRTYLNEIVMNPALFCRMQANEVRDIHNEIYTILRHVHNRQLFIQCVSFEKYMDCVMSGRLIYHNHVTTIIRYYLESDRSNTKGYYCILYKVLRDIIASDKSPLLMIRSILPVLRQHYYLDSMNDEAVANELHRESIIGSVLILISRLTQDDYLEDQYEALYDLHDCGFDERISYLQTVYFCVECIYRYLVFSSTIDYCIIQQSEYIYSLIYESLCMMERIVKQSEQSEKMTSRSMDNESVYSSSLSSSIKKAKDDMNGIASIYHQLGCLFEAWIKGVNRKDISDSSNKGGQKLFCNLQFLAPCLRCYRLEEEKSDFYDMLLEIKLYICEFLYIVNHNIEEEDDSLSCRKNRCYRILSTEGIMTELAYSYLYYHDDPEIAPLIVEVCSVLLFQCIYYTIFPSFLQFLIASFLSSPLFSVEEYTTFMYSLLSNIIVRITSAQYDHPISLYNNVFAIVHLLEEVVYSDTSSIRVLEDCVVHNTKNDDPEYSTLREIMQCIIQINPVSGVRIYSFLSSMVLCLTGHVYSMDDSVLSVSVLSYNNANEITEAQNIEQEKKRLAIKKRILRVVVVLLYRAISMYASPTRIDDSENVLEEEFTYKKGNPEEVHQWENPIVPNDASKKEKNNNWLLKTLSGLRLNAKKEKKDPVVEKKEEPKKRKEKTMEKKKGRNEILVSLLQLMQYVIKFFLHDHTNLHSILYSYIIVIKECYDVSFQNEDDNTLIIRNILQNECISIYNTILSKRSMRQLLTVATNMDYCNVNQLTQTIMSSINDSVEEEAIAFINSVIKERTFYQYCLALPLNAFSSLYYNADQLQPSFSTFVQSIQKSQQAISREAQYQQCVYSSSIIIAFPFIQREVFSILQYRYNQILQSLYSYYRKCSYYIQDPHVDSTGVRRKEMKLPLESIDYTHPFEIRDKYDSSRLIYMKHFEPMESVKSVEHFLEEGIRDQSNDPVVLKRRAIYKDLLDYLQKEKNEDSDTSSIASTSEILFECLYVSTYDIQWCKLYMSKEYMMLCVSRKVENKEELAIPISNTLLPLPEITIYYYADIVELYPRIYNYQNSALEFFFHQNGFQSSCYLNFMSEKERNEVYSSLASCLSSSTTIFSLTEMPQDFIERKHLLEAWQDGEYDTFSYLMLINRYAGRSLQDITHYPVFPWVFNSYNFVFDIHDLHYYRDLSKPMGAQTERRLRLYIDRYEACVENNKEISEANEDTLSVDTTSTNPRLRDVAMLIFGPKKKSPASVATSNVSMAETNSRSFIIPSHAPPYYYGSHYSTPLGCVLYYLLREEPYTYLHILLQDGHFDVTDRLFHSAALTCKSCLENLPEVKELIPDWYFNCSFLKNKNRQNFGIKQDGGDVNTVWLPTMNGTLEDGVNESIEAFISRNLQGLNSVYSMTMISLWLDLIIGYKQQGNEAKNAYNVFYYLTYPNQFDMSAIDDGSLKSSIITQVAHFGQCPLQLLSYPHPFYRFLLHSPRNLRNTLLDTNRESIYNSNKSYWIGNQGRIVSISDLKVGEEKQLEKLQSILGVIDHNETFSFFYEENSTFYKAESASPDASSSLEEKPHLTWKVDSLYPWEVIIEFYDWVSISCIRLLINDVNGFRYNTVRNCYAVEYLNKDDVWESVGKVDEISRRSGSSIISSILFTKAYARIWRVQIFEIPFSNITMNSYVYSVEETTQKQSQLLSSKSDLALESNRVNPPDVREKHYHYRVRYNGPTILKMDCLGSPMFPIQPEPYELLYHIPYTETNALCRWKDCIAVINDRLSVFEFKDGSREGIRTLSLPSIENIPYSLAAIHPSWPLILLKDPVAGYLSLVHLNPEETPEKGCQPLLLLCHNVFCLVKAAAMDDSLLLTETEYGSICVYTLFCEETASVSAYPNTVFLLPHCTYYNGIVLNKDLDCIVFYSSDGQCSDRPVLIYTTMGALRGVVMTPNVWGIVVSAYGVLILHKEGDCFWIKKVNYCGDLVDSYQLQSKPLAYCVNDGNDILCLSVHSGDVLLFDILLMKVLTRIPGKQHIQQICFNRENTGLYCMREDSKLLFHYLPNYFPVSETKDNVSDNEDQTSYLRSSVRYSIQ